MHNKKQNTFQSDSLFTISGNRALSTPIPHFMSLYLVPFMVNRFETYFVAYYEYLTANLHQF